MASRKAEASNDRRQIETDLERKASAPIYHRYIPRPSYFLHRTHTYRKHCGQRMLRAFKTWYRNTCEHGEIVDTQFPYIICECCGLSKQVLH